MKAGVTNSGVCICTTSYNVPRFMNIVPCELDKANMMVYLHPYCIYKNVRLNRVSVKNVITNEVNYTMVTDDGKRYGNISGLF